GSGSSSRKLRRQAGDLADFLPLLKTENGPAFAGPFFYLLIADESFAAVAISFILNVLRNISLEEALSAEERSPKSSDPLLFFPRWLLRRNPLPMLPL
ncbi:MAG TPA: hypothetical protein VFE22_05665, partial [Edaphobacter sp.]|nr:hypothetical protein [Edaphobacter sp.]